MTSASEFDRDRHIKYFAHHLVQLPYPYIGLDTNRLTLVHFAVHALDMLGVWQDETLVKKCGLQPDAIIDWIYNLQIVTEPRAGFLGGTFLGIPYHNDIDNHDNNEFHSGHVAMTYTALCTLTMLGDDLSRVAKDSILASLRTLQNPDGSFQCVSVGSECDTRFLFCACAISHMLHDWSAVDQDLAVQYIHNCRSFDGAIALIPGQEGHGGSTFCGVASLVLMGKLDSVLAQDDWRKDLIRWCCHRQIGGMQGRPNKVEDTCYSYWIGGTLKLLGDDAFELLEHTALRTFVFTCQSALGGFSKAQNAFPDLLHSFYSMSYLNLSAPYFEENDRIPLKQMNCTLGVCQETANRFGGSFP